ncbi:MAG: glycosyltransferase [Polyangiales bacterium]
MVSYAGTHGMAHGLDAILDVAKGLRARDDLRFLFVGDGAQREALTQRVAREAISNVTIMGPVPRDRMTEVYATSDVCFVPLRATSLFNTVLPSKLFEIMAMERPVVLSVDSDARVTEE